MTERLKSELTQSMSILELAMSQLRHSYEICSAIDLKEYYSQEELDDLEAFTSRFARASDILIQKTLRCLDSMEFEDSGAVLDRIHRAEKRNFVIKDGDLIAVRQFRNKIAHEYIIDSPKIFHEEAILLSKVLFTVHSRLKDYIKKFE